MTSRVDLPAEPQSAGKARRFARDVLADWREDDAAELVELLVSELVTNAVLHAGSALSVSMRRTMDRLRIEVADEAAAAPAPRHAAATATLGRGLDLVESLSSSWGVAAQGRGKVVWFEVQAAHDVADDGELQAPAPPVQPPAASEVTSIALQRVPVRLFTAMEEHTAALLREYALMRLDEGVVSWQPAGLPVDLQGVVEALRTAAQAGHHQADATLHIAGSAAEAVARAVEALADADALADAGRLLVGPALPEILACRQWLLAEVLGQLSGLEPSPWVGVAAEATAAAPGHVDHAAALAALGTAVVVADDANRITFANAAAEALLGWDEGTLAGQRLIAIIPERLHEAHVSGYTRFLLTREARILGQTVQVPARRRDGSEVEVELLLAVGRSSTGAALFVGSLQPLRNPAAQGAADSADDLMGSVAEMLVATAPRDLVDAVLQRVAKAVTAQFAAWWSLQPDGRLACRRTWADQPDGFLDFRAATNRQRLPSGVGLPGRVLAAGEPVWLTDIVADANFPRAAIALEAGLRTGVAFPVVRDSQVVAIAEFFAPTVTRADPAVLETLGKVGRLLGMYVQDV